MRIADDEGHGHRLAERAAEAEHDAADHADAGVRQYDVARDLPGRAAESVGRFLENGRHGFEHIARNRGDEGQHHDRENEPGGEHADAIRRAREQRGENRYFSEHGDQERLHVLLKKRREDEQAPDAVDDTGNAGEQLDGYADRAAQPHGQSSVRNSAMNRPTGTAISIAISEVTTVPYIGAIAPNFSVTGFETSS